jgi:hypothetical protein
MPGFENLSHRSRTSFWSNEPGVWNKEKFDLNENPDVAWLTTDNRQPPTPYLLLSKKFLIIKP